MSQSSQSINDFFAKAFTESEPDAPWSSNYDNIERDLNLLGKPIDASHKNLIILVFYISVVGWSAAYAQKRIMQTMKHHEHMFDDTGYNVKMIYVPTQGDSKVECIYPCQIIDKDLSTPILDQ